MSRMIRFSRPDGKECSGFCVEPAAGTQAPAIVALQEWWGLNDQIKGVAARLAAAGYRALVPDLYRGAVTVAAKEAEHLMLGLNFGEAASQDIRGAVQHLKQSSAKVGITGFCMGGAMCEQQRITKQVLCCHRVFAQNAVSSSGKTHGLGAQSAIYSAPFCT